MSQAQTTHTQELPAQPRSEAEPIRTHLLDDAPMRSKVALMVVAGVLIGIGIHALSSEYGDTVVLGRKIPSVILSMLGFLVSGSALILIGQWWIALFYDWLVK